MVSTISTSTMVKQEPGSVHIPSLTRPAPSSTTTESSPAKRRRMAESNNSISDGKSLTVNNGIEDPTAPSLPPASPVVLGFQISDFSEDRQALDQYRNSMKMREQQKALIEKRKVSYGASSNGGDSVSSIPPGPQPPTPMLTVEGVSPTPKSIASGNANGDDGIPSEEASSSGAKEKASASAGFSGIVPSGLSRRRGEKGAGGKLSIVTPAHPTEIAMKSAPLRNNMQQDLLSSSGSSSHQQLNQQHSHTPQHQSNPPHQQQRAPPRTAYPGAIPGSDIQQHQQALAGQQHYSTHHNQLEHQRGAPISRYAVPVLQPHGGQQLSRSVSAGGGPLPLPSPTFQQPMQPPQSYARNGSLNSPVYPPPPHSARIDQPPHTGYRLPSNSAGSPHDSEIKSSFLSPFEKFYDALLDSRTLQSTLTSLLSRSSGLQDRLEAQSLAFESHHSRSVGLLGTLQKSSESLQEMVRREVNVVREESKKEVERLKRRVHELESVCRGMGVELPSTNRSADSSTPSSFVAVGVGGGEKRRGSFKETVSGIEGVVNG